MHEFAANVDGESTGEPAASREAVDEHVFIECGQLVREQAVESTKHLQVKRGAASSNKAKTHTFENRKGCRSIRIRPLAIRTCRYAIHPIDA